MKRYLWVDGKLTEFSIDALRELDICSKVLTVVKCQTHKELHERAWKISKQMDVTAVVCEPMDRHFNCVGPAIYVFGEKPKYMLSGVPEYVKSSLIQYSGGSSYGAGWGTYV